MGRPLLLYSDRMELIMAYQRLGSVRGAAEERKVSLRTAQKWVGLYQTTGTTQSPRRSNSGRPITHHPPLCVLCLDRPKLTIWATK